MVDWGSWARVVHVQDCIYTCFCALRALFFIDIILSPSLFLSLSIEHTTALSYSGYGI